MRQPNAASDDSPEPSVGATPKSDALSAWSGEIRGLAQDGMGVGTVELPHDGRVLRRPIFIPFTAPGDHVEATVERSKGKYYYGKLKTVTQPSQHRVAPACPHYGVCGGCNLEHIAYDEQVRQKTAQLQFFFDRKRLVLPHPIKVLASPQQHKYRRRSKIAVRFSGGKATAGFRKHRSHEIIAIRECFIVTPEILAFITLLNTTPADNMPDGTIELMAVAGQSGKLGVLVLLDDVPPDHHNAVKAHFDDIYGRHRDLLGNLFFEEEHDKYKTGGQVQEHLSYRVGDLTLAFSPEVFIQANLGTNELLVQQAIDALLATSSETAPNTIIDLYCGIGNFSLPLALHAQQVVGVEGNGRSVEFARVNGIANNIVNARFLHQSVEDYARDHARRAHEGKYDDDHPRATHIVIDPPRTGCTPPVLKSLLGSGVPTIIYVSCDPSTLVDDLAALDEKYAIADIIGVDMFPDISHLETVVVLRRR